MESCETFDRRWCCVALNPVPMAIHNVLVLVSKIIVGVLVVGLMIWLRWTQYKNRYKGLNGYSPTLKLGDDRPTPDQASQRKAGSWWSFQKEEHSQPIDQLEPFGRRKTFSIPSTTWLKLDG